MKPGSAYSSAPQSGFWLSERHPLLLILKKEGKKTQNRPLYALQFQIPAGIIFREFYIIPYLDVIENDALAGRGISIMGRHHRAGKCNGMAYAQIFQINVSGLIVFGGFYRVPYRAGV